MAKFLVTNGTDGASSVIVDGLAGVEIEVCRALYGDCPPPDAHRLEWQQYNTMLKDSENWSSDDGKPYWFWQRSFEDGYIRVQRITGA